MLQGGFDALHVKQVALEIESFDQKKQLQIDHVFAGRREARPGETIELTIGLAGENGALVTRKVSYPVPIGLGSGPLYFTVADAGSTNLTEFRQIIGAAPRSAGQLISTVNQLKVNTKAYVRVWRPDAAYQVQGEDYPAPPPSLAMILARDAAGLRRAVADLQLQAGGARDRRRRRGGHRIEDDSGGNQGMRILRSLLDCWRWRPLCSGRARRPGR